MLNESGRRVVYWLGAGASANALPTVGAMPDALRAQAAQLKRQVGVKFPFNAQLDAYGQYLEELAQTSVAYGTLDTYARSLYLQEGKEKELALLKMHLSLYFVLAPTVVWAPPPVLLEQKEYRAAFDLDPRYMGWLALLLGNGLKMNPRVKVISWNYDFQVELALARYCMPGALDQMHERFGIHPGISEQSVDAANFFMTHLNGIAGQEKRGETYHPWYRTHAGFFPDWITALFESYGDTGKVGANLQSGFVDRMTFAWEGRQVAQEAIGLAEHALREADVLVVVGYSFPAFNRLIDNRLMQAFHSGSTRKRLIVQNPSAIAAVLVELFDIDPDQVNITVDQSCDQYHLPRELFT